MPWISSNDPDFRVCQVSFSTLIEIQLEAENEGWGTRWSSVEALQSQVKDDYVLMQSLSREERGGKVRSYRCLVLFSAAEGAGGGVTTIDLGPVRFLSLERVDHDLVSRKAFARIFSLSMGGISMFPKG